MGGVEELKLHYMHHALCEYFMNLIPDEKKNPTEKDLKMQKLAQQVLTSTDDKSLFAACKTRFGVRKNL